MQVKAARCLRRDKCPDRQFRTGESPVADTNQGAPSLYAAREPIFPRRVSGKFRNLKWILMLVLLGIYYIPPWIRWDRGGAGRSGPPAVLLLHDRDLAA